MKGSPRSPRRQRRALYEASPPSRRLRMSAPLSRELRARFHTRSLPVRKGDTVRVMAGSFVGQEERVARVDRRSYTVTLENVTVKTGEEKMTALPVRPNRLLLVRLNLADPWRRQMLQVSPGDLTPEERGETPATEGPSAETPTAATPSPASASEPEEEAP
ncbi:MAG: 50S ribosomal protein L24 [Thermoplasmata archaeon]